MPKKSVQNYIRTSLNVMVCLRNKATAAKVAQIFKVIMSLDEKFQKAAEDVKNLKSKPSDNDLLEIYGLFKQGTEGDITTAAPGLFDLKGKAKWNAWNSRKGLDKNAAKEQYVTKVESLINTIGLK